MAEAFPAATILDGADLARRLRKRIRDRVASAASRAPALRVFLVGENPASKAYVSAKARAAAEVGIHAETRRLPEGISPTQLLAEIRQANGDEDVDGILVQLPLPADHDSASVLDSVDPRKDVDGFHPENVGLLHQGRPRFVPCTPAGIVELLAAYEIPVSGRRAVVLGRSDIVGKPIAALLTARDATVTVCHSKTRGLAQICREADVLIAAIGRPGFVTREFIRTGAAVVDVGINRVTASDIPENLKRSERIQSSIDSKGSALVGDVDYDEAANTAGWLTPVPGGVGPLTVAMLLHNTVEAATRRLR